MLSDTPGSILMFSLPCAAAAFAGAWLWRRFALRRGWLDQPDARRVHVVPTPRGGGIGIAVVLVAVLAFAPGTDVAGRWVLIGLVVTAGGGLLDDLRPLSAVPKLALQALGTLPLAWAWPLYPEVLGTAGAVVAAWTLAMALVNAWNFMDGSDGLVASQAAVVAAAAVALAAVAAGPAGGDGATWLVGTALAAACVGFLPLNLPRAKVFLGDVGSHAIGYAIASLALIAAREPDLPGALLWLPGSAVVIDTGLTLARRVLRGERFWLGHREHLYQRAIASGWSHGRIAGAYLAWSVAASGLAFALARAEAATVLAATAAVYSAGILIYLAMGRRWPRPESIAKRVG